MTEMFKMYTTGNFNVHDLTNVLYDKGLRSRKGGKVAPSRIFAMLKDPIYLGEINWGEVRVKKAKHEPLIDECTFNQVQSIYEVKRKTAEDKLFANTISDDDFKRIRNEITTELENLDNRILNLEKERGLNIDTAQQVLSLIKNLYETFCNANQNLQRQLISFFWEKFEVADGVIIKSVPPLLFAEILKLEQAFYRNENKEKTIKPNVSLKLINKCYLSAR